MNKKTTTTTNRITEASKATKPASNGKAKQSIPADCVILSKGNAIVMGRGLQVLGNDVAIAETKSEHRLLFDLLAKVLVETGASRGQIIDAITAAGMQPSDVTFGVSNARLKYVPKQFVPQA